jgi:hypothetical protein
MDREFSGDPADLSSERLSSMVFRNSDSKPPQTKYGLQSNGLIDPVLLLEKPLSDSECDTIVSSVNTISCSA